MKPDRGGVPGTARVPGNMVSYVWTLFAREQQALRSSPF